MNTQNHYTFGDNERAARRLRELSLVFEEPSRQLLERFRPERPALALDLGAGPGHTTRLVHEVSKAELTIGVEASERYMAQARKSRSASIAFVQDDVTNPRGIVPPAPLVFCRFVLTHVSDPRRAIATFSRYVAPGGVLLLQETASMDSSHSALRRYYELVGRMQAHYGQQLYIGRELGLLAAEGPFEVEHAGVRRFQRSASQMAALHAQNLETWRDDAFAREAFDSAELTDLGEALGALASGDEAAPPVELGLGELALRLR
jgi:SAM-dependent methyltransferase